MLFLCAVPIPQPTNWDAMPPGVPFIRVDLPMNVEYDEVRKKILLTASNTIDEIIKVRLTSLYNYFYYTFTKSFCW